MKNPTEAIAQLADKLSVVDTVESNPPTCTGRVLAADVVADRDSPAADVSAMDGYAIRLSDLERTDAIPVSGEAAAGGPPPQMQDNHVVRIFTGAIAPSDCDAIVKREDTQELDGAIKFRESALGTKPGEHIRRAGENAKAGSTVLKAGTLLTAAHLATMANFGAQSADVFRKVRVLVITTGDEVIEVPDGDALQPWQLRNSNAHSVSSVLDSNPWIEVVDVMHCTDERKKLESLLESVVGAHDAVILTGGVSMGDRDYVPDAVRTVGGEVVFHGLPVRPGKPILGAARDGKLIIGLPGNPVSATIGCHRFVQPLLSKISGQANWRTPCPVVHLTNPGKKTIPLHWMRLVKLTDHAVAEPVLSKGSGDLVSLGQSTGYVEILPGASGEGPWPYYRW